MLARLLIVSFALFLTAGCKPAGDLGAACRMVKRDPTVDGGRLFVRNGDIKIGANKDFISFGSIDCENLVCVRDSNFPIPDGGTDDVAEGYCSDHCIPGTACPASPNPADPRPMSCRPLLLDVETLRLLCNGSPEDRAKCKTYFGNTETPDFCARGSADGGSN